MRRLATILFYTILCFTIFEAKGAGSRTASDFFQTGFSAASRGHYDSAVRDYTLAISLDPCVIYFYYHRAMAYKAMGQKAKAVADFDKCLSMKQIAEAYYELGIFRYDAADLAGAKQYFDKAKALKTDFEKLNFYLGLISYRMNKFDSAESQLSQYINHVKTNPEAFLYLALSKVKIHKYAEVTPLLDMAGLYCENNWKLQLMMYNIYKEMNDRENMFEHISMVIEMGQRKAEYYNIRAKLYRERGENLRADWDLIYAQNEK